MNPDSASNALLIPEKSVFSRRGASSVFVIEGGRLMLRDVRKGLSDGDYMQVLDGLPEADAIVLISDNDMEEGAETEITAMAKSRG